MNFLRTAMLAMAAASTTMAAQAVTLDFEQVTSFASINEFYNGGTDSAGATGPALGISFGGDALGLQNDFDNYFSHAPSPLGVMVPVGADATMNVAAGFRDAISFAYSSDALVLQGVNVWSGLNGSGQLLASFNLVGNAQAGGCSDTAYCRFDSLSSSFAGIGHSVSFGGSAGFAAFDNISITAVPEPGAALLLSLGLGIVFLAKRRG